MPKRTSWICTHCSGGTGAGVLDTLKDSEENEKAKGWEVGINIYKYCISCVYRVFMNLKTWFG